VTVTATARVSMVPAETIRSGEDVTDARVRLLEPTPGSAELRGPIEGTPGAVVAPSGVRVIERRAVDDTVADIFSEGRPTDASLLVDPKRLRAQEKSRLREMARANRFRINEYTDVWVIGTGQSFHLTNDVVRQWLVLEDPARAKTFARTVRFLARHGIEIDTDYSEGSTAHYIPGDNTIGYVMPSRVGLNTLGHEAEHARFERFLKRLDSWSTKKNLAIPYEIDGEADALSMHFGSFMTLLNELHAHRIGNGLDGDSDDGAILTKLRQLYSRTVGEEPARRFAETWTAERVANRSVPSLILEEVRRLNALDEEGMIELAERGWREQSVAAMVSFLRLARVRHGDGGLPLEVLDWTRKMVEGGPSFSVRKAAAELLTDTAVSSPWHRRWKDAHGQYQQVVGTSGRWLRRVQALLVGYWPESLLRPIAPLLHRAHTEELRDCDAVVASLNRELGERFAPTPAERQLFTDIVRCPGDDLADKIRTFVEQWQSRDFDTAWSEMHTKPSQALKQLILGRHMEKLSNDHVCQLMSWCLDIEIPRGTRQIAQELLETVFERRGLRHLSAGLAEERRAPGHELLTPELDALLAEELFDGESAMHRLRTLDMLLHRTYPQELPQLCARVLDALTRDDVALEDHRLAAYFLLPESIDRPVALEWGLAIMDAVGADETPSTRALEMSAEFIRLSVAHALPGKLVEPVRLDRALRQAAEMARSAWTEATSELCDRTAGDLWNLMHHDEPRVWRAALYAIANHPAFVVAVESRLAESLESAPASMRERAARLAEMLDRGFSPQIDRALDGLG